MIGLLQRYPLPVIVLAQLFGTSLWFSINGVWLSLAGELGLAESDLGRLTLSVQAGFIVGTLTLAVTGLAALRIPRFRAVAGGYFGHMWELYAFWTLVPLLIARELNRLGQDEALVPWLSFAVIGVGAAGCIGGGRLSRTLGSEWVARRALMVSGALCLLYSWSGGLPPELLIALLLVWGIAVVADSPQFSALAAATAPKETVGSSLAVMNAVGFGLTLPAIWITSGLWASWGIWVALLLLPGPVFGLWSLGRRPA